VAFELMVDPSSSTEDPAYTVSCLLWSTGDDPQLVDVQTFANATDLRVWLKTKATRHGQTLSVRWTPKLRSSSVAKLVAACLNVEVPAD
jgi:hypothetical protein